MHAPSGDALRSAGSSEMFFALPAVVTTITTFALLGGAPCSRAHCAIRGLWARIASSYEPRLGSGFGVTRGVGVGVGVGVTAGFAEPEPSATRGAAALPGAAE